MPIKKINSLKMKGLFCEMGMKKWDPENEGKSNDVYENKGKCFLIFNFETMCMKTNELQISSNDVDDNKSG